MSDGAVTGITDNAIVGWIASDGAEADRVLEVQVAGEDGFSGVADDTHGERATFSIPIPERYLDGKIRFFDVRRRGGGSVLEGGPLIFEGGLFDRLARADLSPERILDDRPERVEGRVESVSPQGRIEGWAWAPAEPARRLTIEVWLGLTRVASAVADQTRPDIARQGIGDGGYGFTIDLAPLLRSGPHDVSVQVADAQTPLAGGFATVGPFPRDGTVDCPGYLDDAESRELLASAPFEHFAYDAGRMFKPRLVPRLINRLRRERLAFKDASSPAALVMLKGGALTGPGAGLWTRQSYPVVSLHAPPEDAAALRQIALDSAFVFFARPEDILHPSAAGVVMGIDECDAAVWPRYRADEPVAGSSGVRLRRPEFDPVTWRHGAVTDSTLAVRGSVLETCPDAVLAALVGGRLDPLFFWLAGQDLRWRTHPEALTVAVGFEPTVRRKEVEADLDVFMGLLAEEGQRFSLERTPPDHPFPYVLLPARRAAKTSVVVCFRDREELTLRCLHSLAHQRLTGDLELVLVDNRSDPSAAARVLEGARAMLGETRVTALTYDAPFNHSAQNNLGVEAASGEVVVLCNNDIVLDDPTALEQMSAWALCDGIGAVGCRLESPALDAGSYGYVFRPFGDDPFGPCLEESADPTYARFVHACPGVTLALAAMMRDRFLAIGGLDAKDFPVGYNDVDFMLRCGRSGLTHLHLGQVFATHARGSSRSGDNEDLQTLRINQRYGAEIAKRLAQLNRERVDMAPYEGKAAKAPQATPSDTPDPSQEALESAIKARREVEERRQRLAEAVRSAELLSQRLADELAAAGATALGE